MNGPGNDRETDRPTRESRTPGHRYYMVLGIFGAFAVVGLVALSSLATPTESVPEDTTGPPGVLADGDIDPANAMRNPSIALPDFSGALLEQQAERRLELGLVDALPGDIYLDFLISSCRQLGADGCYLDAAFVSVTRPGFRTGPGQVGEPFHVRHGFVNEGPEPLGPEFDVVIYIIPTGDTPGEERLGGEPIERGLTYRFSSDYVIRDISDKCGPTFDTQTEPVTCEWFVHDFPNGLPEGRYDLWAVWQAPCRAWVELGFTDHCADPVQVISLFSSGVNSPVEPAAWSNHGDNR